LLSNNPDLVDAAAPMCIADSAQAEITMAGDFLWGMKVLFNPNIKGTGYSTGTAGYIEMLGDLGQVRATLTEIKLAIAANPLTSNMAINLNSASDLKSNSSSRSSDVAWISFRHLDSVKYF